MASTPRSDATPAPRGRSEVTAAILSAARDLFAHRGYAAVSVRDLAEAAGVNHGLVHRHFGSKEAVLRAVLQSMFSEVGAEAQGALDPDAPDFIRRLFPVAALREQDWRILMRAVLDGFDFRDAGFSFPITGAVLRHVIAQQGSDGVEARERAAAIIAGGIGWLLLEPYLTVTLDMPESHPGDRLDRISRLFQTLA